MHTTEVKSANSRITANSISKAEPSSAGKTEIEDLEFAIEMLRIRMSSASNLSEKIRYYNQIKTLQDNIFKLKDKASSQRSESD